MGEGVRAIKTRRHNARRERGAALIVAIGVLTLLLVIALTFFRASIGDMRTAENTVNGVRAELLADGATAVAIGFLNHDRMVHPSFTSLDHAWRSYFNGTWAVGKPWLWAPLQDPISANGVHRTSLLRGGVPEVDPGLFAAYDPMYIPRADYTLNGSDPAPNIPPQNYSSLQNPFVTTGDLADPTVAAKFPPIDLMYTDLQPAGMVFQEDWATLETTVYDDVAPGGRVLSLLRTPINGNNETLPYEQIHFWTDVDNDGDGLRESMWLPIGSDRFYPEDGLDNDLDGHRDALGVDGIDQAPGAADNDDDEDGEPGVFMYRGDTDGIDNDGDGAVDEADEYNYVIFTLPRPFSGDPGPFWSAMGIDAAATVLYEGQRDPNTNLYTTPIGYGRTGNPIYTRDNDYDLVIDEPADASHYMLTTEAVQALINGDATYPYYGFLVNIFGPSAITKWLNAGAIGLPRAGIDDIDNDGDGLIDEDDEEYRPIRGETMTVLSGRMAILIKDESSKVNINAAGALSYAVFPNSPDLPLTKAFSDGVGPHEYELRVLPGIGAALSPKMWTYKLGGPKGRALSSAPYSGPDYLDPAQSPADVSGNYAYDVSLPGYGWVDDNANLLQLSLDRINYDGLPLNPLDPSYDPSIDAGLFGGRWAGIDEPSEYQRFRPLRNLIAERDNDVTDGVDGNLDGVIDDPLDGDNDNDGIFDELGEFGDTYYRTHQQLKLIANFETQFHSTFGDVRNLVTAHSTDRNERHFHQDAALANFGTAVLRQTTGLKKDLNVTRPQDVARAVTREWTYPASGPERWTISGGTLGARIALLADADFGQDGTVNFLAGLRQENVTISTSQAILGLPDTSAEGTAFTILADAELRAHQIAASIKDFADRDYTRSVDDEIFVEDRWWQTLAAADAIAQTQRIYYTTAGLEPIRINEIMVRPVRRFETEAITLETDLNFDRGMDPNRFVPHNGVFPAATQGDAEAIEEQGFRMRATTTTDAIAAYNARTVSTLFVDTTTFGVADPVGERWNRRPEVDRTGAIFAPGLLGMEAAWATYRRYLDVTDPDSGRSFRVPDVAQFSFQATRDLPAGKYYVTLNTQYVDANGDLQSSAGRWQDFRFAVKIGTREQDWFADVMNIEAYARGGQVYDQAWRTPAQLGSDALGGSGGMAFLQGDAVFRSIALPGNPFSTDLMGFRNKHVLEPNLGFTIEVPARDPAAPTIDDDLWVHIAFQSLRSDGVGFVVNYLEFSQEPDHEWVEVTNASDEAVDLSGWELAVEHHPLGLGPMKVPAGTVIAPKGMLLLGTNKFDYAYNIDPNTGAPIIQNPYPPFRPVDNDPDIRPPQPDDDPLNPPPDRGVGFFSNGIGLASEDPNAPVVGIFAGVSVPQIFFSAIPAGQGSVFYPSAGLSDYVDVNGNGIEDVIEGFPVVAVPDDDDFVSTLDPIQIFAAQSNTKPWDRIVELIIRGLVVPPDSQRGADFTAADVGRIVLGGGIFPNRPEFDLTDNDGDNRVIAFDGIDNDGDGTIDEVNEGVDEGRFAREERQRDLVQGLAPVMPVPGSYHTDIARYLTSFFDFDPVVGVPSYWGGVGASPQWKEFTERRNFPGDNVTVTLYEGPASNNQVADRVTYTQRDVDNRQIDDVLLVTDFDLNGLGEALPADPGVPLPLDDNFRSFWPENTMGVDFARSLERKHPDYTGDRFGTQNRFQATDGNYDDWSDSVGRWERTLDGNVPTGMIDRLDPAFLNFAEFAHALSGTPLRGNVAARYALADTARRDVFDRAEFPNHPLVSPGGALLMPHTSRTSLFSTDSTTGESFLIDPASPNISIPTAILPRSDLTYDSALIGQRFDGSAAPINFFHDLRAFLGDVGTTDSVSLNAGQATVYQVQRASDSSPNGGALVGWSGGQPPQAWAPMMMFELINTTGTNDGDIGAVPPYGYERQYLFQPLATFPATVDNTRWPMPLRTALYASRNFDNFGAADPFDGAEALFVWDGDDGLENGEYDLYVVATEDLSLLARADVPANTILTAIGRDFVAATGRTANREVYLDVEVFRDSNGDRTAWTDPDNDGFILNGDLQRGPAPGIPAESFGTLTGAQPDADGVIHYGVVRVENNFLAVSLRNRSAPGMVARFSRVILAARNKTPGRININTVETRRIDINDPANPSEFRNFYNPLHGLPGVLARPLDSNGIGNTVPERAVDGYPAIHTQVLARAITEQRLRLIGEQPDGRYYELTSDLLADAHFAEVRDGANNPLLRPALVVDEFNLLPDAGQDGLVDAGANRAGAIGEEAFRFQRMQNLITTKGEVFEILVTVQAGYGTDTNGDGRINWRDNTEFTPTAEKTARTIYER